MANELETKTQVKRKFIIGVVLIIASFVIAKLAILPLLIFTESRTWWLGMLIVYLFTWPMLLVGIWLAGMEGYRLATHKYKEVKRKTIHHVKEGSRKAARHVKEGGRKAAIRVKTHSRKAAANTRRAARHTVRSLHKDIRESEKVIKQAARTKKPRL